jgi:D-alanyl-D-alanine carboxypeptidase (penicillin-binding protein 5/6)
MAAPLATVFTTALPACPATPDQATFVSAMFTSSLLLRLSSATLATLLSLPAAAGEDLSGPPVVTAKAWAIADGATGRLLWNHQGALPVKAASTTKVMCARVVLALAATNPDVLDERVTFSKLAAATVGSTAEIEAGESLLVRDCLFGLLLPSGNDAGNALAEHFNERFAPPDETLLKLGLSNPVLRSRVNFIAEMNREARRLGMDQTVYRASFGDGGTEKDRTTTAQDLIKLAWNSMQHPLFREVVSTAARDASVKTPQGRSRTQTWKNTNQLLDLNLGYDGVKTGVTEQAGHCLVASGRHNDDHLLVVVLGCDSDAGRFADARNLFRWAWLQRQKQP